MRQQKFREIESGAFALMVSGYCCLVIGLFGLVPGIPTVPGEPINKLWVGLIALAFIGLGALLVYLGERRSFRGSW